MAKATEAPEESGQKSKGGDTSTEIVLSPLERFKSQARHPTIAKLREPGKVQIDLPEKVGQVRFEMEKDFGKLNLKLRCDEMVSIKHTRSKIDEVVRSTQLLSLLNGGESTDRNRILRLKKKKVFVTIRKDDLRKFLVAAGIIAGK